jgi:hypothetical protein
LRVFFLLLGIGLATFARVSTLTCERTLIKQDNCQIVKHGFLWHQQQSISVNDLKGARLIVGGDDIDSHTYQVVLITTNGNIPFSPNTTFGDKKQQTETASRIDNFARSSNKASLDISIDDRWWIVAALISLTIGIYPILFKQKA